MDITLTGLLTSTLKRNSERVAIQMGESTCTYRSLDAQSSDLAAALQSSGVSHGDCIAIYLKNSIEYVIADLAILKLGAVKIPLNEFQSAMDVAYILEDTGARVLIAHQSFLEHISPTVSAAESLTLAICVGDEGPPPVDSVRNWNDLLTASPFTPPTVVSSDIAAITYTGGTTGKPKGVVQTQGSLAMNLFSHLISGGLSADDVMLLMTPLPHSAGYHLHACLLQGGKVVLTESFSTERFYNEVSNAGVTWTFLVPTMIYRLLDDPRPYDQSISTLKTIVYGAAPMSRERLKTAIKQFGPCFIQLYGQTESPNYITALTKEDHRHEHLHTSCGRAVSMAEIRTSAEDGISTGEIIARTPYLLKEYHRNEKATKDAIRNGWLFTGDIGYIDEEGYLFLQDRAKDMIISGGMNVYSIEVEQVLKGHPAVADAAVVGLPHPDWGEQVHAVIVGRDSVRAEDLIEYCRDKLSRYKLPKSVEFREALPLTAYGKIDKKSLRADNANLKPA